MMIYSLPGILESWNQSVFNALLILSVVDFWVYFFPVPTFNYYSLTLRLISDFLRPFRGIKTFVPTSQSQMSKIDHLWKIRILLLLPKIGFLILMFNVRVS